MTQPRNTPRRYKRIDVAIPPDLLHRVKLVRALTGIPTKEWIRTQLTIATDLELCNRPGAMWLRPSSMIYKMQWGGHEGREPIAVPITTSAGGERVWVREILPEFHLGKDDDGLAETDSYGAVLCDLSADPVTPEPAQVEMRGVLVAVYDVQPMAPKWQTGLGQVQARKARERRRRKEWAKRVKDAELSGGVDSRGRPV